MPELPEVETIRVGLTPLVVGREIRELHIHHPRLRWVIPAEQLTKETVGQTIRAIKRRGKYLLLACGSGHILIHLGMSGRLQRMEADAPNVLHDHVVWLLDDGYQLRLNDPRRFGAVLWVEGEWRDHFLLAKLGPEPLETAFQADYLHQQTKNRRVPIKHLLMNGAVVVGVGNIYASEALFLAKVHPALLAGELSKAQCALLVEAIKQVLNAAIAQGGTTLRDYRQSNGQPGYFAVELQVYGRAQKPCLTCTTPIQTYVSGQRSTFYCPHCQPRP